MIESRPAVDGSVSKLKIFFSMSGEGLGHATRVRALVEQLRRDFQIRLFAPGDALTFLREAYWESDVAVQPIPGLRFHYDARRRLDYVRTGREGLRYLRSFGLRVKELAEQLRAERPALVVTDFEPSLPRAAERAGIPYISVSHQHFLLASDLSGLPLPLRCHARFMGWVVASYYRRQRATVISSFFFPPIKRPDVIQVGVLLRPEVSRARPANRGHLVAYLRRFAPEAVLEALDAAGPEVRVYGLGERPPEGNLRFRAIRPEAFLDDLASSEALVCTAGNQLVGEALYLGKPVLAMPEAKNYEQFINAHFLGRTGAGTWRPLEACRTEDLRRFLDQLDGFRASICRDGLDGTARASAIVRQYAETGAESPRRVPLRSTASGWRGGRSSSVWPSPSSR